MMRSALMAAALALAACTSLQGASNQPPPFSAAAPAPVAQENSEVPVDLPAGAYRLDPRHASVLFRIRHMQMAWFTARFEGVEAELTFDPADPSRSRLVAAVDADSVNTGVLERNGARTFDLSVAEVLGGDDIVFTTTAIERTGRFTGRVTGDLFMNGQTHPLTLDATFAGAAVDPLRGARQVLGFSAHGTLDRTQWGVDEWRSFTGDEVQIVIEAEFVHAS